MSQAKDETSADRGRNGTAGGVTRPNDDWVAILVAGVEAAMRGSSCRQG